MGPREKALLSGMPRRIGDYPDAYAPWNSLASYGSNLSVLSTLLFFVVVYDTLTSAPKSKSPAPTTAPTLEWLLTSPPAYHTFSQVPAIKTVENGGN